MFEITVTGDTGTIGSGTAEDPQSFWMSAAAGGSWPASAYRLESTSLSFSDGTSSYEDTLRVAGLTSPSKSYTAVYRFRAVGFTSQPTQVLPVQQIASGTQIKHTDLGSLATLPAIQPATNDISLDASVNPDGLPGEGGQAHVLVDVTGSSGASLDAFEYTVPAGTSVVPGSTEWNGQPVDDPVLADGTLYFQGPFELTGQGDRLEYDVQVAGTSGTHEGSVIGRVGDAQIDTTTDVTDNAPAPVTVNVNTPPSAVDDVVDVVLGGSATVDVLANDTDPDGDTLTVSTVGTPVQGIAEITPEGQIRYTPADGATGQDSFTYTVSDGRGGTATVTVNVTISQFPPPAATDDQATTETGHPVEVDVLANDTGDGLRVDSVGQPTHGTAEVTPDGQVRYTPGPGYTGTDTITYTVIDSTGRTTTGTLTVTVEPQSLEARDDRVTTTRAAGPITVPVTVNDTGSDLVVDSATARHGRVEVTDEGVRYTPDEDFTGTDEVTYTVRDSDGRTATAVLTVVVRNTAPTMPAPGRQTTRAGGSLAVPLDPRDGDGDRLRIEVGRVSGTNGAAKRVHITPRTRRPGLRVEVDRSFSGRVLVPVTVRDGHGGTRTRNVRLVVRPRAPRSLGATVVRNPAAYRKVHHPRFRNDQPVSRVLSHRVDSRVTWRRSPTGSVTSYEVYVNGELVCRRPERSGRRQSCRVQADTLRRGDRVRVVATGPDGVRSARERVRVPRRRTSHLVAVVYFPVSEFRLSRSAVATLDRVAAQADRAGYDTIRMVGHTDSDNTHAFNRRLSWQRAREVRGYLLRHSDALSVPLVSGRGEARPARPNTTRRGKAANRRVEIYAHG